MVAVVVFEFSVMRCQPLRRALYEQLRLYRLWKWKLNKNKKVYTL
ncbi:acetyltransferase [Vibrio cholerae]|uniref:Acetyltransferase n=1 Tax=Vibrio cholerae TaxID=666 RepID=A0A5Q6PC26_VIBCL|nr:acetyltransferase [Vibrio cholerae]KAA1206135.1 acetyltransferase [Vibrio cholerae]KAA1252422.1 acetyltransferase [Vibrio cholerae]